jgi:hypothetical protein
MNPQNATQLLELHKRRAGAPRSSKLTLVRLGLSDTSRRLHRGQARFLQVHVPPSLTSTGPRAQDSSMATNMFCR